MIVDFLFEYVFWWLEPLARGADLNLLAVAIFLILVAVVEIGFRIGRRMSGRAGERDRNIVGFVTGGMLAVLAFFLGISLSMADGRYQQRRNGVLEEANAIGTTWLRAQLVRGAEGEEVRRLLQDYARVRLEFITSRPEAEDGRRLMVRSARLQSSIWAAAGEITRSQPNPVDALLLASLNQTFDAALTNQRNFSGGVPPYVLRLLFIASVLSVGAIGYSFGLGGKRQLPVTLLLLLLWTASTVLIVDIDLPLDGRVRVDIRPMEWTVEGMGATPPPI